MFMMLLLLSINSSSVSPEEDIFISSFEVKMDTKDVNTPTAAMMDPITTCLMFLINVGAIS